MMGNIVVVDYISDEVPKQSDKQSKLWEEYASKLNAFTDLIIKAGIDPELLTDVVRATISLYRDKV